LVLKRREHIKKLALGIGSLAVLPDLISEDVQHNIPVMENEIVRHSVSRWCYDKIPLATLIDFCKQNGIHSIELLESDEYKIVCKKGLTCAVANGPASGITKGFNDTEMHEYLFREYQRLIPIAADAGIPHIICFSGNRNGLDDDKGLDNCLSGLEKVVGLAEKYQINLIMELLNSKVDHVDYQCDHSAWGIRLVKKTGSDRFKLLYDIYHMQIMEGNVIDTIQKNIQHFAHFHTAGVPGRGDLDQSQELNYQAIFKAIKKTGYSGFIGQEFIPKKQNPLESLLDSIQLVKQA
jgi:hydroxypyruvate isomerase